jgi:16S rRNA (cytidine1402-2'-O)-methyltransferase
MLGCPEFLTRVLSWWKPVPRRVSPLLPSPEPPLRLPPSVFLASPPSPLCLRDFYPPKGRDRQTQLQRLAQEERTLVLYEAPHRLLATLKDLAAGMGADRRVAIARELTKQYEEVWRGDLGTALTHFQAHPPRGEFTLVITGQAPPAATVWSEAEIKTRLLALMADGLSRSQASRTVAQETTRLRRDLYQIALSLPDPPASSHSSDNR